MMLVWAWQAGLSAVEVVHVVGVACREVSTSLTHVCIIPHLYMCSAECECECVCILHCIYTAAEIGVYVCLAFVYLLCGLLYKLVVYIHLPLGEYIRRLHSAYAARALLYQRLTTVEVPL